MDLEWLTKAHCTHTEYHQPEINYTTAQFGLKVSIQCYQQVAISSCFLRKGTAYVQQDLISLLLQSILAYLALNSRRNIVA